MATVVQQLRLRSAERDTHAVAARVSAQLHAGDLSPAALPPGARLVVRRIGSGLPPWRIDPNSVRPPADWQTALSRKLDDLLRRAVRARGGPIPEDAEAILFFDEAEVASRMAKDWMSGTLNSHWCWKILFPRGDFIDAMLRTWVEHPECVPAAMAHLVEERRAGTFTQRLPAPILENLIRGMIHVFALRHLEPLFEAIVRETPLPVSNQPPLAQIDPLASNLANSVDPPPEPAHASISRIAAKPLRRAVSGILRAFFLELAVELYRAPHMVRTRQWAERLQTSLALSPSAEFASLATSIELPISPLPIPKPVLSKSEFGQNAQSSLNPVSPVTAHVPRADEPQKELGQFPPTAIQAFSLPSLSFSDVSEGMEIQTSFGGVFYLINVALYLGYYGDFSTPEQPGLDLPLWDFLAQVCRKLAGEPLFEDAVWPFLNGLAKAPPWEELQPAVLRIRAWLDEIFAGCEDPVAFVLRHTARVRLTDTRLDIFLMLEALPVEIRIARLDRDPGWIPAAGRFVAFHFL